MWVILFLMAIATIPAYIASQKGRSFFLWWIYGVLLFIFALIHSIVIKPSQKMIAEKAMSNGELKKCPFCAELVLMEAIKCKHCGSDLPNIAPCENTTIINESDFEKARSLISLGERSMLISMIKSGLDVHAIDGNGKSLIDYAKKEGNEEMARVLENSTPKK